MRWFSFLLSLIIISVIFSPLTSAENNVIVNFVDTKTGSAPENIKLEIISEDGEYWNITEFPKELDLEPGNYSVIASLNFIGNEVTTVDLHGFEVGTENENYSVKNEDYKSYGFTVVAEYEQNDTTEIYTVYLTFEGGPIEYISYVVYGVVGISALGILRSLQKGLTKKKKGKGRELASLGLEVDLEFTPFLKDIKFDQVLTYEGSDKVMELKGEMKASEAWEIMKKKKKNYNIMIRNDEGGFGIIANEEFKKILKKEKMRSGAGGISNIMDIGGKLEDMMFWLKIIALLGIIVFAFFGLNEELLFIRNRINEFL